MPKRKRSSSNVGAIKTLHGQVFGCADLASHIKSFLYWPHCDRLENEHRPCARYIYAYEDDSGRQRFVCQHHDWEMPRNCVVS